MTIKVPLFINEGESVLVSTKDGKYVSNGGRVLGFVCLGDDVKDAQDKVYAAIDSVSFENSFYRHDIGGKR